MTHPELAGCHRDPCPQLDSPLEKEREGGDRREREEGERNRERREKEREERETERGCVNCCPGSSLNV